METFVPDKAYPMDNRIVPTPRRAELQKEAKKLGIKDYGLMSKDELGEAVRAANLKKGKK